MAKDVDQARNGKKKMTKATIMRRDQLDIEKDDWNDANVLDAILMGRRLLRSDAGMPARETIIVADVTDEDMKDLEEVGAALALQRAIMCVMTSEIPRATIDKIFPIINRIETRSNLHEVLLAAEIFRCGSDDEVIIANPPESMYRYKEGTVPGLMRRALDAMDEKVYGIESLAVANSMCLNVNLLDLVDAVRPTETRAAVGSEKQSENYPLVLRNNLAWLAKNPDANEDRTERYLKAYGTTIQGLGQQLAA